MNLTDQIASMLADAEKATGAFKMPMSLRNAPERIAVDKFNVEARTRLPAALRALKVAVRLIENMAKQKTGAELLDWHEAEFGDRKPDYEGAYHAFVEDAQQRLATIAKALGNGEESR